MLIDWTRQSFAIGKAFARFSTTHFPKTTILSSSFKAFKTLVDIHLLLSFKHKNTWLRSIHMNFYRPNKPKVAISFDWPQHSHSTFSNSKTSDMISASHARKDSLQSVKG